MEKYLRKLRENMKINYKSESLTQMNKTKIH